DSFVGMALALDLMAATGEPLSRLVSELPRYRMVKDQYPIVHARRERDPGEPSVSTDVTELWDRIASAYLEARADRRDGLRLEWDDRWVHIRASNTEPIVRVIAEAAEPAVARELSGRIGNWLGSHRSDQDE